MCLECTVADNADIKRRLRSYQLLKFCRVCLHGVVCYQSICVEMDSTEYAQTDQGLQCCYDGGGCDVDEDANDKFGVAAHLEDLEKSRNLTLVSEKS